ncbi:hypothetical protein BDF19DRAFT_421092 [Syncephalis fuscata]|nr:hypothetical protein BDF19DRAFT_421092 [Syncephalis fuscata]
MIYIPILVIERVAAFADSDSLVLLSCCSKWLRYCVSQHNNVWHQRYRQYYNLADGNEIKWLAWYVKTVRASRLLTLQTKKTVSITQLNNQHIEWFHAFCYRRATDANWLNDTPYLVKDLVEKELNSTRSVVLERITYHHPKLRQCFIAEQCQPIREIATKRFWRLRRLFQDDANCKSQILQFLISDRFVVTINRQKSSAKAVHGKIHTISIWPVNRVSIMRPRQFSCSYSTASICGRWIMINSSETTVEETNISNIITTTRVFDLANGQMCMGTVATHQGETFLLRTTEETATVFSRILQHSDTTTTLKWNVWEFSNCHLGYGPRCLMQGKLCFENLKVLKLLLKNWIIIGEDEIRLAMISTECGYSNACIKDVKPIWTRSDCLYGTIPLFGSNRILVISESGWTICSSIDGTIIARIDVENLSLMLKVQHLLDIDRYNDLLSLFMGRFILYDTKEYGLTAVDLAHPNRTRNVGITNSEYLYETCERRSIIAKFEHLARGHLLSDTFSTKNAALIMDGKDYKIIDLSVYVVLMAPQQQQQQQQQQRQQQQQQQQQYLIQYSPVSTYPTHGQLIVQTSRETVLSIL